MAKVSYHKSAFYRWVMCGALFVASVRGFFDFFLLFVVEPFPPTIQVCVAGAMGHVCCHSYTSAQPSVSVGAWRYRVLQLAV